MKKLRVAVPAIGAGDLDSTLSGHFGHCDVFSIVDIDDGEIVGVESEKNVEHSQGGCLVPVRLLEDKDVNAIIVGGMGMRPLVGFREAGIRVYLNMNHGTVGQVIQNFVDGKLQEMSDNAVCGGGNH
ncbi:MAG: NifB/NifX family molybdenum-iron cluster-binding protein [Bacillota bacterium]